MASPQVVRVFSLASPSYLERNSDIKGQQFANMACQIHDPRLEVIEGQTRVYRNKPIKRKEQSRYPTSLINTDRADEKSHEGKHASSCASCMHFSGSGTVAKSVHRRRRHGVIRSSIFVVMLARHLLPVARHIGTRTKPMMLDVGIWSMGGLWRLALKCTYVPNSRHGTSKQRDIILTSVEPAALTYTSRELTRFLLSCQMFAS